MKTTQKMSLPTWILIKLWKLASVKTILMHRINELPVDDVPQAKLEPAKDGNQSETILDTILCPSFIFIEVHLPKKSSWSISLSNSSNWISWPGSWVKITWNQDKKGINRSDKVSEIRFYWPKEATIPHRVRSRQDSGSLWWCGCGRLSQQLWF